MTELTDIHAEELIRRLWHQPTINSYGQYGILVKNPSHFSAAYTDYYQRQWITMAGQNGIHVWFKTPQDLNAFISHISAAESLAKEDLSSYLEENWGTSLDSEHGGHTLNLALSLLLMVKFGPTIGEVQPHIFLQWTSGCLKECLRRHFNADPILDTHEIRLSQNFNAWSLKTIGAIEIGFTDNLDDHLFDADENEEDDEDDNENNCQQQEQR
ncbi:hypothetical protein GCG54_00005781 [Colletotrichum gloeosporioides]|uniref:Uncharacterized protein n=1 Tax=Colletotrichum gloeosporioides TaxID=474922 RepID=A0A8H4CJQ1_COLGL|nr:uncharacterized protein GCG54_00005781 [Colletotrichum gloeosporioides]KAF3805036.1 hypothetical protein GCG54_00005781 [Colletotrichum gloeosporioides]